MKRECTRSFWFIMCCFWYVFFLVVLFASLSVLQQHIKMNMFLVASVANLTDNQGKINHLCEGEQQLSSQSYFGVLNWKKKLFNYWKLATKRTGKPTHSHQMNREKWFLSTGNKCNEIKLCRVTKELNAVPTANNSIGSNSIFTLWYAAWLKLDRVLGSEWQRLTSASERHVQ